MLRRLAKGKTPKEDTSWPLPEGSTALSSAAARSSKAARALAPGGVEHGPKARRCEDAEHGDDHGARCEDAEHEDDHGALCNEGHGTDHLDRCERSPLPSWPKRRLTAKTAAAHAGKRRRLIAKTADPCGTFAGSASTTTAAGGSLGCDLNSLEEDEDEAFGAQHCASLP